jgi:broad specificity phosphatase PhoE
VVLLRHGETEFIVQRRFQGQMEAPLTAAGEDQIRRAAAALADPTAEPPLPIPDVAPYLLVHSPLQRARRGAELVAEAFRAAGRPAPPLLSEPGFSEIAQGAWEGLTDAEIGARFGDSLAAWRRWPAGHHAPGGESLQQVRHRVEAALTALLTEMARGTNPGTLDRHQVLGYADHSLDTPRWALIVGHGGAFRVLLCSLLGLPDEHFWNFDFGLAAITIVEIRAGRAVLRALNLEAHLGRELGQPADRQTVRPDESGAL